MLHLGDTVAIWAHPDDETYLGGGLMAALRDAGHRVVCVTATRGELGGQAPPEVLRRVRTEELGRALAVLGVEEHHWLDLPDGSLDDVDPAGPTAWLVALLAEVRPRTVLTFGPDGITGHPDHIAVGRWARAACAAAGLPGTALLEAATTAAYEERFGALAADLGVNVGEAAVPTPDEELAVNVVLDGELLDRKVAALRQLASQTDELRTAVGDDVFREWVALEAFRPAVSLVPSPCEAVGRPSAA